MTTLSANHKLEDMRERTRAIFNAAMRSFIATGKPVTSQQLFKDHSFGIKPAMIRWELNTLSQSGYFYQTHPSGGRLPTDKAYRTFIKDLLKDQEENPTQAVHGAEVLREGIADREWKGFVSLLADQLQAFSFGYEPGRGQVFESGLSTLFDQLDIGTRDLLLEIVEDIEGLPDRISANRSWWEEDRSWPQIFIGSNPFARSRHVAVVAERLCTDDGDFYFLALGPKRMDYEKSLRILGSLREFEHI